MKRIVAYMLFLIFLCMLIPIIFTNRRIEKANGELVENEEVKQEQQKDNNKTSSEYDDFFDDFFFEE